MAHIGINVISSVVKTHETPEEESAQRRFKFIAMVGFCSTVVVAWQNTLTNFGFGLVDGGTGGIFWTFIFGLIASKFLYLTLCELSSSFPTAGGQYQWVAECAPASARNLLSYCTGWLLVLGWHTTVAGCGVIIGNLIKFCIVLYHPNNAAINSQWFPTLLAILSLVFGGIFNLYCEQTVSSARLGRRGWR